MLGSGTAVQYGMPAAARLQKEEHGAGIKGSHGCMIDTVMLLGQYGDPALNRTGQQCI